MKSIKQWFSESFASMLNKNRPRFRPDCDVELNSSEMISEIVSVYVHEDGKQVFSYYPAHGLIKDVHYDVFIDIPKLSAYCAKHRVFCVDLCELLHAQITSVLINNEKYVSITGTAMSTFQMEFVYLDPKCTGRLGNNIYNTYVAERVDNVTILFTYGEPSGAKCMLLKPKQYQKPTN